MSLFLSFLIWYKRKINHTHITLYQKNEAKDFSVLHTDLCMISININGSLQLNPQALPQTSTLYNLGKNWKDGGARPKKHEKKNQQKSNSNWDCNRDSKNTAEVCSLQRNGVFGFQQGPEKTKIELVWKGVTEVQEA